MEGDTHTGAQTQRLTNNGNDDDDVTNLNRLSALNVLEPSRQEKTSEQVARSSISCHPRTASSSPKRPRGKRVSDGNSSTRTTGAHGTGIGSVTGSGSGKARAASRRPTKLGRGALLGRLSMSRGGTVTQPNRQTILPEHLRKLESVKV